jgi:hypothetical protein
MNTHKQVMFTVKGSGEFPLDMLRYDMCCPARTEDAQRLIVDEGWIEEVREIQLIGFTCRNTFPTVDRWKSFGWHAEPGWR